MSLKLGNPVRSFQAGQFRKHASANCSDRLPFLCHKELIRFSLPLICVFLSVRFNRKHVIDANYAKLYTLTWLLDNTGWGEQWLIISDWLFTWLAAAWQGVGWAVAHYYWLADWLLEDRGWCEQWLIIITDWLIILLAAGRQGVGWAMAHYYWLADRLMKDRGWSK